jgi:hypothetical protein
VGLGNVTNESKATMFTSPTFTGTVASFTVKDSILASTTVAGGTFNLFSNLTGSQGLLIAGGNLTTGTDKYVYIGTGGVALNGNHATSTTEVHIGGNTSGSLTKIWSPLTVTGNIGASNFSGSSSGTNTGDQTLPTLSSLGAAPTASPTFTGTVTTTAITTGGSTTAGTITGNWALTGKFQATYADLAEYYEADLDYEPGTVVELGGEKEVTIAEDSTCRVAGVVSTNPAYLMNKECAGKYIVAVALQGRVPVKVRGRVRKGDFLVSGGSGFARPSATPVYGSVIGKAIENFDGVEGVIEVMIGRM